MVLSSPIKSITFKKKSQDGDQFLTQVIEGMAIFSETRKQSFCLLLPVPRADLGGEPAQQSSSRRTGPLLSAAQLGPFQSGLEKTASFQGYTK